MSKTKTGYEIINEKVKSFSEAANILLDKCPSDYNLQDTCYLVGGICTDCWRIALEKEYEVKE